MYKKENADVIEEHLIQPAFIITNMCIDSNVDT